MTSEQAKPIAEAIYDEVFNFAYSPKSLEYQKEADTMTKLIRHVLVKAITDVLERLA